MRGEKAYGPETLCVGIARLGSPDQRVHFGTLSELMRIDFGAPLHSLVITGELHPIEDELLSLHSSQ